MVASISLNSQFNWRLAFWIGSIIAVIGFFARTRLRETTEFVNYNFKMKKREYLKSNNIDIKAIFGLAAIVFMTPLSFYMAYIYLGDYAKKSLYFSSTLVINHNLKVSIISVFFLFLLLIYSKNFIQ